MSLEAQEFKIGAARSRNVAVKVIGHLKGCEDNIVMELNHTIPASEPNNDGEFMRSSKEISAAGGLSQKENDTTYRFYPLTLFAYLTFEIGTVHKVIL